MEATRSHRALALTFPASALTPRSRLRISHGISSLWAGEFYTIIANYNLISLRRAFSMT
jgi:hypothetical protein